MQLSLPQQLYLRLQIIKTRSSWSVVSEKYCHRRLYLKFVDGIVARQSLFQSTVPNDTVYCTVQKND